MWKWGIIIYLVLMIGCLFYWIRLRKLEKGFCPNCGAREDICNGKCLTEPASGS